MRRRSRTSSRAHPRVRNVHYPGLAVASAARARARALSRLRRAARPSSSIRRHRLLRLPQPARRSSCCRRTSATTARSRSRSRTRSSGRWAPSGARRWASPTALIRVSVGIEDERRPDRGLRAGARLAAALARAADLAPRARPSRVDLERSRRGRASRRARCARRRGRRRRRRACAGRCVWPWIMRATPCVAKRGVDARRRRRP